MIPSTSVEGRSKSTMVFSAKEETCESKTTGLSTIIPPVRRPGAFFRQMFLAEKSG
jgi:hypothetical protein